MVGRIGHARLRRAPVHVHDSLTSLSLSPHGYMEKERVLAPTPLFVVAPVAALVQTGLMLGFRKPRVNVVVAAGASGGASVGDMKWKDVFGSMKNGISSSFLSSATGEGSRSISSVALPSSSMLLRLMVQAISTGKQPSATGKKCHEQEQSSDGSGKKRKVFPKKVIRTPVISSKITDIPADECSWRKYGQKPIKGSPYPRLITSLSVFSNVQHKKHVERAMDDPMMLIMTYEEDHRHTQVAM
ncbi:putative WRKY transcription factor 11 [Capsicum galapagoense]